MNKENRPRGFDSGAANDPTQDMRESLPDGDRACNNELLTAALHYADLGYRVFPCTPGGKTPITTHGCKDATTAKDRVERWWAKHPTANIGLATDGLLVVDVDVADNGQPNAWLAEEPDKLATLTTGPQASTPRGGRHFYFKQPEAKAWRNTASKLARNVDTRATGGYVIAPPSIGANGQRYRWLPGFELDGSPHELPELSQLLIEQLDAIERECAPSAKGAAGNGRVSRIIPEGKRNATLTSLAGSMRRRGMTEAEVLAALQQANKDRCDPPLPTAEVERIATSIARYEPKVENESWPTPIPFGVLDVPEFPIEAIPTQLSALRDFCEAVAESVQVPVDAVVMLALAVGGSALARRIEIRGGPDWIEPANLFCVVAMLSGERKSAMLRLVTQPHTDFEREENARLASIIEQNRNDRMILDDKLKKARDAAVRAKNPDDKLVACAEVSQIAEELRACKLVVPLQLMADDATPEAVSQLLNEQNGRLALLSPEGDVFDLMCGRYSDGVSRLGVYLKGHAGDDLRVNRVGRPSEFVRHPALTCGLAVQPDVLVGLMDKPQLRGRGLLARFLYSLPTSKVGYCELEPPSIPDAVKAAYALMIRAALELEPATDEKGGPRPHVLTLSPDAATEFLRFRGYVEKELRSNGELSDLSDWGSKLPGAVLRIAGVLHGLRHAAMGNPSAAPIDAETMLAAMLLAEYLVEHAKAAFNLMGSDPATRVAKRILDWLADAKLREFSKRDAHVALGVDRAADLDEPLGLIEERKFIRQKPVERAGPGRKPSPKYEVNPDYLRQNRQNRQNSTELAILSNLSN